MIRPSSVAVWPLALILALLLRDIPSPLLAADRDGGREIYRKLCAECHGRKGEGVRGKYNEPLQGSWSVEKLARVIDKTMPDGAPEKCVGKDAESVARYIHQTFYSRASRNRPAKARVELVRLTNRQFANAAADLLKRFTGEGSLPNGEQGLKATYYNARGFNRDKLIEERIDPIVAFNFRSESPDPERIGRDEFSIQWQGGLIAPETGDYEFVVRSPNGVRLWLNDEQEPLIDAWVASGSASEHKTTLRLLGGRVYPLRLHFFKFKEKSSSVTLLWKPPYGTLEPIPARSLTPARPTPTLVLRTPFPPDDSSVGYERGTSLSKAWDEAVTQSAVEIARHVSTRLDTLAKTKAGETNRAAKIETFAASFVETAHRRPLSPDQKRVYVDSQIRGNSSLEEAVKRIVLLAVKSPRFLYLGLDHSGATPYATAEHLSFALWDSLPDAPLLKAAAANKLQTADQIRAQARRMLQDPRTRTKTRVFLHHWLQCDRTEDLSKDSAIYPGFTPEIVADLRVSLDLFIEDVVWSKASDYRQLLLAEDLFLNARLAAFYGVAPPAGDDFAKVRLGTGERSGVLTHPFLLAAFSYPKSSSPIHRGVFLTRSIVGQVLRPPPTAVAFNDADFPPDFTMREKIVQLTKSEACQSCHSVINPLGFSLEHFDAVGRFRERDRGQAIDASGHFVAEDGQQIQLSNARDVAAFAASSSRSHDAFIERLFHQMVKQPVLAYGSDLLERLRESFASSNFNIQELMIQIATRTAAARAHAPTSSGTP